MKKQVLSFIFLCVLSVVLLAACGQENEPLSDNSSTQENENGSEEIKNEENKKTKLVWINHSSEESTIQWQEEMIKQYTELNPDVEIDVQTYEFMIITSRHYKQNLQVNDAPDIFALEMTDLDIYVENSYVADLTDTSVMDHIDIETASNLSIDDRVYVAPTETNVMSVTYSKDAFEEAGIEEVPETLEEFYAACEKLVAAGYEPIANGYKDTWTLMADLQTDYIPSILLNDSEAILRLLSREDKFSESEEWRDLFVRLGERFKYSSSDPFGTSWDGASSLIASREAAMTLNGNWAPSNILPKNEDINLGVFPLPFSDNPDDPTMVIQSPSTGWAINDNSQNKETALDFLSHMSTPESGELYSRMTKNISIINGVKVEDDPVLASFFEYIGTDRSAKLGATNHNFPNEYRVAVENLTSRYLIEGGTDVEKLLNDLDQEFDLISGN